MYLNIQARAVFINTHVYAPVYTDISTYVRINLHTHVHMHSYVYIYTNSHVDKCKYDESSVIICTWNIRSILRAQQSWNEPHMMTSSNGNIFRVTGHLCGEFTGHRWIPRTKASDAELWCFLWSAPDKRLSKQWWGWCFETPSRPLWRHCNEIFDYDRVAGW